MRFWFFCIYCSRALPFASEIIYSAGEFEPGSEALVCLFHRQGFKLVSDWSTNYLSGIWLGLTLRVICKSLVNWFVGKYTRRTVLLHQWILFASQSRHLVMGLKNRMSLTQALGLLRCRHQAIQVKDIKYYQIQCTKITDTIYPFNAKKNHVGCCIEAQPWIWLCSWYFQGTQHQRSISQPIAWHLYVDPGNNSDHAVSWFAVTIGNLGEISTYFWFHWLEKLLCGSWVFLCAFGFFLVGGRCS